MLQGQTSLHFLDYIGYNAPNQELIILGNLYWFVCSIELIGRHKANPVITHLDTLNGILAVDIAYGLAVVVRIHSTVHDDDITLIQRSIYH